MTMARSLESANTLSNLFHALAVQCYDNPKRIFVFFFICLMFFMHQLPKLEVDMSAEAMLRKSDSVRLNYAEFKKTFGSDNVVIISIPTNGKLDNELLEKVSNIHQLISDHVPHLSRIDSLVNARYTYGDNNELIVEDLLENWPSHRWTEQSLKEYIVKQDAYRNRLISEDGLYTAILVELNAYSDLQKTMHLDQSQSSAAITEIQDIVNRYSELDIAASGKPVIQHIKNVVTLKDSAMNGGISLLVTIVFLSFFFRRVSGVVFPLIVVYGSIIGAASLMAFFGSPFTLTISVVFPLMMAVGIADSVHILNRFYRNLQAGLEKRQAIIEAISHAAPAVTLTTLTTAAGFMSFVAGDLASTAELGFYAACAVMLALLYTVILLPALISVFNIRPKAQSATIERFLDASLTKCADFSYKHARSISILSVSALLLSLLACQHLYFSYDPISQFPDSFKEKRDNYLINDQYQGNNAIEVVIDSGHKYGIYETAFIENVELLSSALGNTEIAGIELANTYSVLDILKEVHRALNGNQDSFYAVPKQRDLVAQELLLFEIDNRDDLLKVVDDQHRRIRLSIKMEHADAVEYEKLLRDLEKRIQLVFPLKNQFIITGNTVLSAESVPKALETMSKSYIIAAVLIIIMMMVVIQSGAIGFISIVPNLLPILLVLNIMVIMKWPLDMATIMFGAIALGIVVDDTLHFLYHFKLNYRETGDALLANKRTLLATGPALFITTVIFASGAAANMLSSLENIFAFGLTMSLATVFALLADIIVVPALLVSIYGDHETVKGYGRHTASGYKEGSKLHGASAKSI